MKWLSHEIGKFIDLPKVEPSRRTILKGLTAFRAVNEVGVKRIAFRVTQFAVEIGGQELVNLFVNGRHKKSTGGGESGFQFAAHGPEGTAENSAERPIG